MTPVRNCVLGDLSLNPLALGRRFQTILMRDVLTPWTVWSSSGYCDTCSKDAKRATLHF